jgi:hypothetical protein
MRQVRIDQGKFVVILVRKYIPQSQSCAGVFDADFVGELHKNNRYRQIIGESYA